MIAVDLQLLVHYLNGMDCLILSVAYLYQVAIDEAFGPVVDDNIADIQIHLAE